LPFLFIFFKTNKLDRYIGELSYPIYVSHLLVISFLQNLRFFLPKVNIPDGYFGIFASFLTIFFSILLLELVSKPIEKFRQKRVALNNI
jgi:peptidoglycan/LPS O-acetylase OafA/YrhL